jgi:ribosomal protein S18 acetylase RimI-like enzyme
MNGNEDSGEVLARLQWIKSPPMKLWNQSRLEDVRRLIFNTTGEKFSEKRLRMLPLDERFGMWALCQGDKDHGILWAMKLDSDTARVLAFSVSNHLQGQGFGARGWSSFAEAARAQGINHVQLEVRQDNKSAIQLYHRRGLRPRGFLTGFYRGHDGWLMSGPLRIQPSSQ